MGQDTTYLVNKMDMDEIDVQLAVQCAPVIAGIKISNLFITQIKDEKVLEKALEGTGLVYFNILRFNNRTTYLIFRKEEVEEYISRSENQVFFQRRGYMIPKIEEVLPVLQKKYHQYMTDRKSFPHEIGLLLGYPLEDVEGFINNQGKDFLYTGYWKVFAKLDEKKKLFHQYDNVVREFVYLVSEGLKVKEISYLYETRQNTAGY